MTSGRHTMRVTWMDGQRENYPYNRSEVADGELHLWTEYGQSFPRRVKDEYWIPLANLRVRTVWDGA